MKIIDVTGQTFGRLTVLRRGENNARGTCMWLAQCTCGSPPKHFYGADLRRGFVQSCGCYNIEKIKERSTVHGRTNTREYRIWSNMITRCTNENAPQYGLYGARGIRVCARWQESFESFFSDMGLAPTIKHSIDRIDGTAGYEPGNCRWATPREQAQNQSTNRKYSWKGEMLCVQEIARRVGIPRERITGRLNAGWSIEEAIAEPARQRLLTHQGETDTLASWARRVGISNGGLRKRLLLGWSVERALSEGLPK